MPPASPIPDAPAPMPASQRRPVELAPAPVTAPIPIEPRVPRTTVSAPAAAPAASPEPALALASAPAPMPAAGTSPVPSYAPAPVIDPPQPAPAEIPGAPSNLVPISSYAGMPGMADSPPISRPAPAPAPQNDRALAPNPLPQNGLALAPNHFPQRDAAPSPLPMPQNGAAVAPSPVAFPAPAPLPIPAPAAPNPAPVPMPQAAPPSPGPVEQHSLDSGLRPGSPNLIPAPGLGEPISEPVPTATPKPRRRLRWPGVVFPLLFLLLSGVVVYLVLDLSGIFNTAKVPPPVPLTPTGTPNQQARDEALAASGNNKPARPVRSSTHLHPVSENIPAVERLDLNVEGELPPTPVIDLGSEESLPVAVAPAPFDPTNPSSVLEKFLGARSLEERLPILTQSNHSPQELAISALGKPLPEIVNRRSIHYMEDRSERRKEHFFEVFFQIDPNERAVPILVQLNDWGDGAIRVHTDAFLDLFEDRLGKFAEGPVEGAQTFHVVADAYKHCFDEIIPQWEKKSFLKLRTHPRMAPRLIAYFSRTSSLADEISEPNALPWGESGICTVTVRWNTEVPDRPFVELIRINGFTWNP